MRNYQEDRSLTLNPVSVTYSRLLGELLPETEWNSCRMELIWTLCRYFSVEYMLKVVFFVVVVVVAAAAAFSAARLPSPASPLPPHL